jgi:hypothetical protein
MNATTALLQIIAGALILNTPLIIFWVIVARKMERKVAK